MLRLVLVSNLVCLAISQGYQNYVKTYESMAGSSKNPTSGSDYQGKEQSQLQAFGKSMNTTFNQYIPSAYMNYASQPVNARVASGGNGAGADASGQAQTSGSDQGDSYTQYMQLYAGIGGQSQKGGQSGGSSYNSYYSKYLQNSGVIDLVEKPNGQSKDSEGKYGNYMKKYASKYTGGGYEKYMRNFQQASSTGSYADYAKAYTQGGQGGSYDKYYQKYMKQYADKYAGGSNSYSKYSSQYSGGSVAGTDAATQASQANSATDLTEMASSQSQHSSDSTSQTGSEGYQKYMKQYTGGSGGYDKYMKQYTNTNYQQTQTNLNAVPKAEDAKSKADLDKWKEAQYNSLGQFVPAAYVHFADKTIDAQYDQRLKELQNTTGQSEQDSETSDDVITNLYQNLSSINLIEESGAKEEDVTKLRNSSQAGVEKIENLVESLRHAAQDSKTMEKAAAVPSKKVKAQFSQRHADASNTIKTLQAKVDSATDVRADELTNAEELIEKLGSDQRKALRHAHARAYRSAMNSARGIQSKVREESRKVRTKTDRLSRMSRSDQEYATKLQNRAEAASDAAEEQGELLARKTEDSLDKGLSKAQDTVRQQEQSDLETLHDLQVRVAGMQSKKSLSEGLSEKVSESQSAAKFLAQRVENSSPDSHAAFALFAWAGGALALVTMYVKFRRRPTESKAGLLGYSAIAS
eukprot:gnl/MRDRNA2_/MRDRNA2_86796_c0_seq4.p1 gnl/MRDRNA2_/MRDRNA2_86796_c0~~gnl/MRDRNA2_/MRDRNA2_86796_c0_seq4.p1  ORF type:complete len:692 (+),score=165.04 gnl/MRDRNA2_/MRDRNA2_86796_c0_seq4:70-2145(+)